MKKVIVIGNSPSILKNKLGKVIDSYDIVIRLNHCPIKGYEKYIGNKFNIWATTKNEEHNNFVPDNYSELLEVWYRTPMARKKIQNIPKKDENGKELNITSKIIYKNKNGVEHDELFKHFFERGELRGTKHEPDTGLITILQAIRQFDDVTIHGFDFYQESEGFIQGYYREKQKDTHDKHPEDKCWKMSKETGFSSKEAADIKNKIIDELINNHGLKVLEKTNGDKSMKVQGKVWGKTQDIFKNSNFELHRIEVNKGGFCSKHKHVHKINAFYVEKGKLKITIHETDYDLVDETIVTDGDLTIVKPGKYHEFEALEDTIAYEIYWVELNHDDIERETVGGMPK